MAFTKHVKTREFKRYLSKENLTHHIIDKCQALTTLNTALHAHLPIHLQDNVCVANFQSGRLTLQLNDSAFSLEMRYLAPKLQKQLQAHCAHAIHEVKCIVRPPNSTRAQPSTPLHKPHTKAAMQFEKSIEGITAENVKDAMQRLAETLKNS